MNDIVNNPSHYQSTSGIQCIDAIRAMMPPEQYRGYLRGNVLKYLWRFETKGGVTDLHKAEWYLKALIAELVDEAESD